MWVVNLEVFHSYVLRLIPTEARLRMNKKNRLYQHWRFGMESLADEILWCEVRMCEEATKFRTHTWLRPHDVTTHLTEDFRYANRSVLRECRVNFDFAEVKTSAAVKNEENIACSLARDFFPFLPGPVFVTYTYFLVAHRVVAQLGISLQYSYDVILKFFSWNKQNSPFEINRNKICCPRLHACKQSWAALHHDGNTHSPSFVQPFASPEETSNDKHYTTPPTI